jgi:hypothetical protein
MPGQTGAEARIDQNLANASLGIDRFSNSGSAGISGIVAANANAMQANQGLGIAAAQNYYDRQNAYTNAMGQYAGYKDKQFEQNQLFPWQSKMQNIMQIGAAGNQKITQGLSGLASTGASYAGAQQMDAYIKALGGNAAAAPAAPAAAGTGIAGAASAAAPIINDVMKLKIQTPAMNPSFGGTPSAFFPPAPTPKIGMPQAQAPAPSAAIGGGITVPAFNPSFGGTPSPYVTPNPIMQMPVIGAPQPAAASIMTQAPGLQTSPLADPNRPIVQPIGQAPAFQTSPLADPNRPFVSGSSLRPQTTSIATYPQSITSLNDIAPQANIVGATMAPSIATSAALPSGTITSPLIDGAQVDLSTASAPTMPAAQVAAPTTTTPAATTTAANAPASITAPATTTPAATTTAANAPASITAPATTTPAANATTTSPKFGDDSIERLSKRELTIGDTKPKSGANPNSKNPDDYEITGMDKSLYNLDETKRKWNEHIDIHSDDPLLKRKAEVWKSSQDMPDPIKEHMADHLFNSGSDPRIAVLGATGKIDINDSKKRIYYKEHPKELDKLWEKSKKDIKTAYDKDPQAMVSKIGENRKVLYNNINRTANSASPKIKSWEARTDDTTNFINEKYFPSSQSAPAAPAKVYLQGNTFTGAGGQFVPKFIPQGGSYGNPGASTLIPNVQ